MTSPKSSSTAASCDNNNNNTSNSNDSILIDLDSSDSSSSSSLDENVINDPISIDDDDDARIYIPKSNQSNSSSSSSKCKRSDSNRTAEKQEIMRKDYYSNPNGMKRQRLVKDGRRYKDDDKGCNLKYKHKKLNEVVDLLSDDDDDDDDCQTSCQVQQQQQQLLVKSSTVMDNCYDQRSNQLQMNAVHSSTNENINCNKNDNALSDDDDYDDDDKVEVVQMKSKKKSSFMKTGQFLNRLGTASVSRSRTCSDSSHSKTDNNPDVIVLLESEEEVMEEENTKKRPILITSDAKLNSDRREEEEKKNDAIHNNSYANDFKSMTNSRTKEEVKGKETMIHSNSIINDFKAKPESIGIDEEALENDKMNHSNSSANDLKLQHLRNEEDAQEKMIINHSNSSVDDAKPNPDEIEEKGVKKETIDSKPISDAEKRMASSFLSPLPPSNSLSNSPASSPSKLSLKPLVEIIPLLESQQKPDDLYSKVDESGKASKKKMQKENSDTSNIVIGKYMPVSTNDLSSKEENVNYLLSMSSSSFILGFHRMAWTTDKYCRVLSEVERFPPDQKKYSYLFDAFQEFGDVLKFDDIEKDRMVMKDNRQFQYGSLLPLGVEVLILFHTFHTF